MRGRTGRGREFRGGTGGGGARTGARGGGPGAEWGLAVFRIVAEAVTNVGRHAHATRVDVALRGDARGVTLTVVDDGLGLAPEANARRHGMVGMRERALAVGGVLTVSAAAPHGPGHAASLPSGGAP